MRNVKKSVREREKEKGCFFHGFGAQGGPTPTTRRCPTTTCIQTAFFQLLVVEHLYLPYHRLIERRMQMNKHPSSRRGTGIV